MRCKVLGPVPRTLVQLLGDDHRRGGLADLLGSARRLGLLPPIGGGPDLSAPEPIRAQGKPGS